MSLDILLILGLAALAAIMGFMVIRRPAGLTIEASVGKGRQLTIGGEAFPPGGKAQKEEHFPVPESRVTIKNGRVHLAISPGPAAAIQEVSLERKQLRSLNIDASLEDTVVVYGGYDGPTQTSVQSYTASKCLSCAKGFIVCGVNPQCS